MVAISLYRGNLHRVPDVPRRWLMPNHTISLKDFRSLLRKREKTLSRLRSTTTTTSNPNLQEEFVGDNGCSKLNHLQITIETSHPLANENNNTSHLQHNITVEDAKDQSKSDGDPCLEQRKGNGDSFSCRETNLDRKDGGADGGTSQTEQEDKQLDSAEPPIQISNDVDLLSDREKKKRELEENLKVLNEKKHNLVQMLKQILNAEEEMKRRSSMQASVARPPVPLQVEVTTDLGSNPRQAVNRMVPEANFCGDLEGESEDVSNHNTHARNFHQMRSTSPSASSPLRRLAHSSLQHTVVSLTNRPSLGASGHTQTPSSIFAGVASSPSRFAPSGHQGHPVSLPPISMSGTQCTASSPSPAASGGTSVFRDSRLTSPSWN